MTNTATLAARINAAAADQGTAHFGSKAYISAVYDALWDIDFTMEEFKAECVELHRLGKIALCRADMPNIMDREAVKLSEIMVPSQYGDSTFNLIEAL